MRRGLVIQGPLVSRGRHGGSAHIHASKVTASDIVTHSCLADVEGLVRRSRQFFDAGIVVATWKGEPSKGFPGAHRLEVPPFPAPPRGRRWHEYVASNNKLRQFCLSEAGTKFLAANGAEMVVKIRTDMLLNLGALVEYADRACEQHVDSIVVPWLPHEDADPQKFTIPDFYFAGRTEIMQGFFGAQTWSGDIDFAESVHLDIPLRYAFALDYAGDLGRLQASGSLLRYFHGHKLTEGNRQVLRQVISARFIAGPQIVYEQIVWRGQPWAQTNFNQKLFDARWSGSAHPSCRVKCWIRFQDLVLADYGRAAALLLFATGSAPRWMLLAHKSLRSLKFCLSAVRALRNWKTSRFTSFASWARLRVSSWFCST